jgi:hypothetical protein
MRFGLLANYFRGTREFARFREVPFRDESDMQQCPL